MACPYYPPTIGLEGEPVIAIPPPMWDLYKGLHVHKVHFCLCGRRVGWCNCDEVCKQYDHYAHTPTQWNFCHCHLTRDREFEDMVEEALTATT